MGNIIGDLKAIMSEENIAILETVSEYMDADTKGIYADTIELSRVQLDALKRTLKHQRAIYEVYPTEALQVIYQQQQTSLVAIPATKAIFGDDAADITEETTKIHMDLIAGILSSRGAVVPHIDLDAIPASEDPFGFKALMEGFEDDAEED